MAYIVDALTLKLESKICYHREANEHYLKIKAMVDELVKENKKLRDDKMEYLDRCNRLLDRKSKLEDDYEAISEQLAPIEEQLGTAKKELVAAEREVAATQKELAAAKRELVAAKEELAAAKQELVAANHGNVLAKDELARKKEELDVLRKKLQKSEAMCTQLQQQIGSAPGSEPGHSTRVLRSTHKRERLLQGPSLNDADGNLLKKLKSYQELPITGQRAIHGDDLEMVGKVLIKGFTDSTDAGWHLGLKDAGKLNEKPFQDACAMKLPPSQSAARASELCTQWQELINNQDWKPFKTVTVDGNRQEDVIDADDEKLQGLKMAWGDGPYNSVIRALMERKEHNCDGTVDIWNYKEGRKATAGEFVEHILDQLKQFRQKTY